MRFENSFMPDGKGDVCVAFSGGVDSVAVAHFLKVKARKKVKLLHYNHGLRQQNDLMQMVSFEFSKEFGCSFITEKREASQKNSEADLREDRLKFLSKYTKNVLTGHHLDDAVESYFINTFRGHSEYTLPIPPISHFTEYNLTIHRPFIIQKKETLVRYVEDNNLTMFVVEDETNKDEHHLRNFIRNSILPLTSQRKDINVETIIKKRYLTLVG